MVILAGIFELQRKQCDCPEPCEQTQHSPAMSFSSLTADFTSSILAADAGRLRHSLAVAMDAADHTSPGDYQQQLSSLWDLSDTLSQLQGWIQSAIGTCANLLTADTSLGLLDSAIRLYVNMVHRDYAEIYSVLDSLYASTTWAIKAARERLHYWQQRVQREMTYALRYASYTSTPLAEVAAAVAVRDTLVWYRDSLQLTYNLTLQLTDKDGLQLPVTLYQDPELQAACQHTLIMAFSRLNELLTSELTFTYKDVLTIADIPEACFGDFYERMESALQQLSAASPASLDAYITDTGSKMADHCSARLAQNLARIDGDMTEALQQYLASNISKLQLLDSISQLVFEELDQQASLYVSNVMSAIVAPYGDAVFFTSNSLIQIYLLLVQAVNRTQAYFSQENLGKTVHNMVIWRRPLVSLEDSSILLSYTAAPSKLFAQLNNSVIPSTVDEVVREHIGAYFQELSVYQLQVKTNLQQHLYSLQLCLQNITLTFTSLLDQFQVHTDFIR